MPRHRRRRSAFLLVPIFVFLVVFGWIMIVAGERKDESKYQVNRMENVKV